MDIKLSCPFCGRSFATVKKVYIWKRLLYCHYPVLYSVHCCDCCMARGPLGETWEEAIDEWNERRDTPVQSLAVKPQEIGKNQDRLTKHLVPPKYQGCLMPPIKHKDCTANNAATKILGTKDDPMFECVGCGTKWKTVNNVNVYYEEVQSCKTMI